VLVSLENALQPLAHRPSLHRITKFAAQSRDRRRVV